MLTTFVGDKQDINGEQAKEWLQDVRDHSGKLWSVRIKQEDMEQLFADAFSDAMQEYENQMGLSTENGITAEDLCVIFTGGSLINRSLKALLTELTEKRAGKVIFSHEFQVSQRFAILSKSTIYQ